MNEYFIVANSFTAPFFSDTSERFQEAETPEEALKIFAKNYNHPCGLYAACCYENEDSYHKNIKPLAKWLCNEARFMQGKTGLINKPMLGKISINGVTYNIDNPKEGTVLID